jgi:S1-C subfamily serine protease
MTGRKQHAAWPLRPLQWILLIVLTIMLSGCGGLLDDTTPPSSPLLSVGSQTDSSVRLVWSGAYDDTGISAYHLYRDGKRIAIVSKTEYTDRGVNAGTDYTYEVVAVDEAGNRSDKSAPGYVSFGAQGSDTPAQTPEASGQNTGTGTDPGTTPGTGSTGNPSGTTGGRLDIQTLSRSTVKVYIIDDDYNIVGTGSGSILDRDGFILTNAHVVEDETGFYNRDGFVGIALTDDVRTYSQPQYLARVMASDYDLDLAVVRLVSELDGTPLRDMPTLYPVTVGDADALRLGDDINVLGFPGVGGETITFTSGKVSGFIDEDYDGLTDWIKTDALVNHGNSGGTAVDQNGLMIGVPTAKIGGEDNDQMFFLRPVNSAVDVIAIGRDNDADGTWAGAGGGASSGSGDDFFGGIFPGDNPPATGNTVAISGTILDADTGNPIEGALFVMLEPGISVDDWLEVQDDQYVVSVGESDADGWFETMPEFPAGNDHGVVVWQEGYELLAIDEAISFEPEESGLYDIGEVYLSPVW